MTKMPEPKLFDGVVIDKKGRHLSTENGYTADQLKQYGRDLLEEVAKIASRASDNYEGAEIAHKIRAMKEAI